MESLRYFVTINGHLSSLGISNSGVPNTLDPRQAAMRIDNYFSHLLQSVWITVCDHGDLALWEEYWSKRVEKHCKLETYTRMNLKSMARPNKQKEDGHQISKKQDGFLN